MKTQSEARAACSFDGGKLYEPKDENMLQNVTTFAKNNGLVANWLGIKEGSEKGTFMHQSDNSPLVLKNWAPKVNKSYNEGCFACSVSYNIYRQWYYVH